MAVTIRIDGKEIRTEKGTSVLTAALENGIYIPHLCHHKDLPELGSCRLCIVAVEGQEGVTPSCELKAEEGLSVITDTPEIQHLRKLAMELLLSAHPEDCSTCPKYGRCELQTLIQYMGVSATRMMTRVKGFPSEERNPLLIHDMNRCVLCGRCVRACGDLRKVGVLQYNKKELETYVGTLHDRLLADADCRFCGACAEVCPTGTIRDYLNYTPVEKKDTLIPCRAACPVHTDVPRYLRLVRQGKYAEATAVIHEKLPFPECLGRVCTHVCEADCRRGVVNEPVSIRNLKRYAAEHTDNSLWISASKKLPPTGKKAAVIGGGPAGMSAAYYLAKQGHSVTIFEAREALGGQMQFGIPSYRLPMPGNELPGVLLNSDFLEKASRGEETGMGKHVVVLGGGNVAFDCARTAVRLGAESVALACLEKREMMLADDEEIEQAKEEGVDVQPGRTFEKITGEEGVTGVALSVVKEFYFDENRRAVITKVENSEYEIPADTVIFAVGQRTALPECGIERGRANSIAVKNGTLETSTEGIFACGDAVYGTKTVIQAVASGREAASAIDRYLGGDGDISETLLPMEETDPAIGKIEGFGYLKRKQEQFLAAEERKQDFRQVSGGICDADHCGEAERCLQCDLRFTISGPHLWSDYDSSGKEAAL